MATFVSDTLSSIDSAIGTYTESVFVDLAGPITTTCQIMGLVGLAFMALNTLTQWVPMRVGSYLVWGVRFVIITAVATSWAQFQPIYTIVTQVPADVGGNLLAAAGAGSAAADLYDGVDILVTSLFDFSDRIYDESARFGISLTATLVWVAGALLACVTILVAGLGKVGLAMAVSLAPIFIPTLLFRATGNLFESWVRFTIGFALIPLVLAGVIGAVLGTGTALAASAAGADALSEAAQFIIVAASGIFLMAQVPTLVNGLSGSIVATANGFREARQAMDIGGKVAKGTLNAGGAGYRFAEPRATQAVSAVRAAGASEEQRGGATRVAAMLQDAKATSDARKRAVQNIGRKNAEYGRRTSWSDRREAGNAAVIEQAREHMRQRGGTSAPKESVVRRNPHQQKADGEAMIGPWGTVAKK